MGHGVDDEKWMVSGDIIWGDPSEEFVWNELRKIIQRPWSLHNGKEIAITASFVDSGYLTPQVYKFCKQMQPFRVFATKGVGDQDDQRWVGPLNPTPEITGFPNWHKRPEGSPV